MKKMILLLIMCIDLISFTSATINVYGNTTRPTFNIELAEDDGATFLLEDNTNYYLQCFIGGYGYAGYSMGPASHEFNLTTNSTHRWMNLSNFKNMCDNYNIGGSYKGVLCRWSENQSFLDWGGEGYMPWAFDYNDSGLGHNQWTAQYGNPGGYWGPEFKCLNNKDSIILNTDMMRTGSSYASRYVHHPEIAVHLSYRNEINRSYTVEHGGLWIELTSDHTFDELADAISDAGFDTLSHITGNEIALLGSINFNNYEVTFSRKILSKTLWLDFNKLGLIFNDFSSANYHTSEPQLYSTLWKGTYTDSSLSSLGTSRDTLDQVTADNINVCLKNPSHYNSYDGWSFSCGLHSTIYFEDGENASNNKYYGVYDYVIPSGITGDYTSYWENVTFYNDGKTSTDLQLYPGYIGSGCYNISRTYDMKNVVSDRSDGRPIVSYNAEVNPTTWCGTTLNATFHGDVVFKIQDENGIPIENANVTLKSDGNYYTGLTSASGVVIHDTRFYHVYYDNTAPNNAVTVEEGYYNLTITATNYADYSTNITLGNPESWTIALESRNWNYSEALAFEYVNNSGTVAFACTLAGNCKNAGDHIPNTNSTYINSIPEEDVLFRITDLFALTTWGDIYTLGYWIEGII